MQQASVPAATNLTPMYLPVTPSLRRKGRLGELCFLPCAPLADQTSHWNTAVFPPWFLSSHRATHSSFFTQISGEKNLPSDPRKTTGLHKPEDGPSRPTTLETLFEEWKVFYIHYCSSVSIIKTRTPAQGKQISVSWHRVRQAGLAAVCQLCHTAGDNVTR